MKKLYVGNLPWRTNDDDLLALFERHGEVLSARVVTDRETGKSRGFGFVEMDDEGATRAIEELDGQEFESRTLKVNEARERPRGGGRRA